MTSHYDTECASDRGTYEVKNAHRETQKHTGKVKNALWETQTLAGKQERLPANGLGP